MCSIAGQPAEARSLAARPARRTPPVRAEAVHDRPRRAAPAPLRRPSHRSSAPAEAPVVRGARLPAYPDASSQYSSGRPRMRALAR